MKNIENIVCNLLRFQGRLICGSKSLYKELHPDHTVVFNANLYTKEDGKVWYGDIDLTLDSGKLQDIANQSGKTIYILREMDGRFENENNPLLGRAVDTVYPE